LIKDKNIVKIATEAILDSNEEVSLENREVAEVVMLIYIHKNAELKSEYKDIEQFLRNCSKLNLTYEEISNHLILEILATNRTLIAAF
jgi:metal-responsive CopG/Arc/MetJ family transcriptional regulator